MGRTCRIFLSSLFLAGQVVLVSGAAGCKDSDEPPKAARGPAEMGAIPMSITVKSEAFTHGQPIPRRHTGDGEDVSPPLGWSGLPEGAKQLALIVDDPDAPVGTWDHWVLYKMPVVDGIEEGISSVRARTHPPNMLEGKNGWGTVGYRGPAPPPGKAHRYYFRLYALDAELGLAAGLTKAELLKAIKGHVIAAGELMGTHKR